VLLARPETLRRSSDDIWSYAVEPHHLVFAAEIRRVEEAAAVAPAESPVAAAPRGEEAPAGSVVQVGTAAGDDDASELDQATTVRVQRALNARNLGAGVPRTAWPARGRATPSGPTSAASASRRPAS
jgi:hypothetical protein